jgi:hypothetical protein
MNTPTPTPTPRTDAAWAASFSPEKANFSVLDLARTLERELAALTAERDQLRAELATEREKVRVLREALSDAQSAALPWREWPWTEGAK